MSGSKESKDILKQLIEEIKKRDDITLKEFIEKVRHKIREMGGLLTEEGAALLVAKELGIDAVKPTIKTTRLKIEDLVEGLSRVRLVCRVIDVDPPLIFKKENRELKLAKIKVADESGTISVTLWPPHVGLVENLQLELGDTIRIENARSTRFRRRLELNIDERGAIVSVPHSKEIPSLSKILGDEPKILEFTIISIKEPIQVETRWGIRPVSCIEGVTDNERIRVVLWGRKANWVKYVKVGDLVRIRALLNTRKEFSIGGRKFIEYSTGSTTSVRRIGETSIETTRTELTVDEIEVDRLGFSVNIRGVLSALLIDKGFRAVLCGTNNLVEIAMVHSSARLDVLKNSNRVCKVDLMISNLEPVPETRSLFESTLWSKCIPASESDIFKNPDNVDSLDQVIVGRPFRVRARVEHVDVTLNYYCNYCGNAIGSAAHRCFDEKVLSITPVVTMGIVLDDGEMRVKGVSSDITLLESLSSVSIRDVLDFFMKGEGIEPVLKYQLDLSVGKEYTFLCRSFNIKTTTLNGEMVIIRNEQGEVSGS
ncbi:MAG: hypothetical protein DRJ49_03525 [Thermoprotei archaeon]|nr:MAG: hypothetical protein DRJ49_03525 [Thermoprotei archaeon]